MQMNSRLPLSKFLRKPHLPSLPTHSFSSLTPPQPLTVTSTANCRDPLYTDVPKPRRDKSERKPYPTPIKVLIQRAKLEKEARKACPVRMLENPPDNGLLVPELVDVAHRVYRARKLLLSGVSKLIDFIPVQRCGCRLESLQDLAVMPEYIQ